MLFLKRRDQKAKGNGSCVWCDANESLGLFIKAYPQNAGEGTKAEQIERILSRQFIQKIYDISYSQAMYTNPTSEEEVILRGLPTTIKRIAA